jgi:hypothetical protein
LQNRQRKWLAAACSVQQKLEFVSLHTLTAFADMWNFHHRREELLLALVPGRAACVFEEKRK